MNEPMQPQLPYVSVVVPAYNAKRTIAACVESLLAQDYPRDRYEVIIVDNNSKDATADLVKVYPVRLLFERKQSADAARNTGIRQASGGIVAFTDADCVADPYWLSQLLRSFTGEDIVGVAGHIAPFPTDSLIAEFLGSMIHHINPTDHEPLAVPTGNVAYRMQALLEVGLFDDSISWAAGVADIDLCWRIQVHTGRRVVHSPSAIVFHSYRDTVVGLFRQFRRYGYGEIVFTTLHKGNPYHQRTPKYQLMYMLRQVRALVTYGLSFVYRTVSWPNHRRDRKYLLWPVLWFVAEGGNMLGKLDGLIATRFFRRNPFAPRADIVR